MVGEQVVNQWGGSAYSNSYASSIMIYVRLLALLKGL